jgi:hypothetical protein
MFLRGAAAALIAAGAPSAPGVIHAAEPTLAGDALERLQLTRESRQRLLRGEIVPYPVAEHGDRELAVGLAMLVRAPLGHVAESLTSGDPFGDDLDVGHGLASDPARWPALRFADSERDEAVRLVDAAPGTRFNLSPAELGVLRALRGLWGRAADVPIERISVEYRRLLRARAEAYGRGGLAAIEPYARAGGATTDPAAELRSALPDVARIVRYGPELEQALARYPAVRPRGAVDRVYWVKRRVQGRPHLSLLHRLGMVGPDVAAQVERSFYAGHSYNTSQIVTGAVAHDDGTLIFNTSRISTDEVLGLGNQVRRSLGRRRLNDERRKRLEELSNALSRRPAPPPQTS